MKFLFDAENFVRSHIYAIVVISVFALAILEALFPGIAGRLFKGCLWFLVIGAIGLFCDRIEILSILGLIMVASIFTPKN